MTDIQIAFDHTFTALADPTRRSVIERLARGPRTVTELARAFTMALPTFMAHLRILERSGLIHTQKVGRVRTCTLDTRMLSATEAWMAEQRQVWEGRLDRMDDYVRRLHAAETAGEQ